MISRWIFGAAVVVGGLAMLAMVAVTLMWMTAPTRIFYRESSPVRTDAYSVEVKEHGSSYFLTSQQKRELDGVRSATPIVWFGGFGIAFVAIIVGAAALLKMKDQPHAPYHE
jgi:hypothetical protein